MKKKWCFIVLMISIFLTPLRTYASALMPTEDTSLAYSFFKIIYSIVIFALVLAAAYFVTKFIAKKGTFGTQSKNMKIIETLPLGMDKSVYLIKVGEQYLLLAGTKSNLTLVSDIDKKMLHFDEIGEAEANKNSYNFDHILNRYKRTDNASVMDYTSKMQTTNDDDYMASTKMKLSNLKSMVRGNKFNE